MFKAMSDLMMIIKLCNFLLGFVVFSILGYMSVTVDKNIAEIVKPGLNLSN